jgi:hypothetical protein
MCEEMWVGTTPRAATTKFFRAVTVDVLFVYSWAGLKASGSVMCAAKTRGCVLNFGEWQVDAAWRMHSYVLVLGAWCRNCFLWWNVGFQGLEERGEMEAMCCE